jgi:hypothetical protein
MLQEIVEEIKRQESREGTLISNRLMHRWFLETFPKVPKVLFAWQLMGTHSFAW